MPWALCFAFASAGRRIPARIAMMAMTTRSSMRVKPTPREVTRWGKRWPFMRFVVILHTQENYPERDKLSSRAIQEQKTQPGYRWLKDFPRFDVRSLDRDCHDEGRRECHRRDKVQMGDFHVRARVFIRALPEADGPAVARRALRAAGPNHGSVRRLL